ncbi:hypothetical protein Vadar_004654 [Vaccinium darrowii]|uniref:Uncharacterized protein n=1 Tax=Vaccinium darrowii TaxID=229202 RepID=A0ACB7YCA6_9ERIC|nr:hypothetical protein Vadar_004654 [Vaccinium darrowii]
MGSAAPRRFCRNRFRLRRSKGLVQEQFLSLDVASLTTSWDWVWFNNVLRNKLDFLRKPGPTISNSAKDFLQKLLVKDPVQD